MLTCSNCGASVRNEALFCTACGTRLNAPAEADATSAWPTAPTTTPDASVWEAVRESVHPTSPTPDPADEDEESSSSDSFSWSWGTPSEESAELLDEESGTAVTISENEDGDVLPDPTELEILDGEPADTSVADDSDEVAPDTSDAMLVIDDSTDEDASQETLAAWATDWESSSAPPLANATAETEIVTTSPAVSDTDDDDADEDTVAKAERLIGQLSAMIPNLARPRPAPPTKAASVTLAQSLENALSGTDWSDLRQVLTAAQDEPRNIDNMIAVSGRIGELLSLLDERDQLAQAASDVAAQIRAEDGGATPRMV